MIVTGPQADVRLIAHLCKEQAINLPHAVVVGIAGGSASGKTHVARELKNALADFFSVVLIHADDYFHGRSYMKDHGIKSFDDPRAVDLQLLAEHLQLLRRGIHIVKPLYSFPKGEREGNEIVRAAKFIIVEGLFVLMNPVLAELDFKVFVKASEHSMFWRRLLRDVKRTGQTPEEIAGVFLSEVYPAYKEHVLPTAFRAHVIIRNEMVPEIEMIKETGVTALKEVTAQLKTYLGPYDEKVMERVRSFLARLGFTESDVLMQHDIRFIPGNVTVLRRNEIVRLREEYSRKRHGAGGKSVTLTYKGPFVDLERRIFEVKASEGFKYVLAGLGYQWAEELRKQRFLFTAESNSVEIVLDVLFLPDGATKVFLEIRAKDSATALAMSEMFKTCAVPMMPFRDCTYWDYLHVL